MLVTDIVMCPRTNGTDASDCFIKGLENGLTGALKMSKDKSLVTIPSEIKSF